MSVEIRTVTDEEFENWSRAEARGFGAHASDEYVRIARSFAELDRTFAAYDGEEIVGTTTTRTFTITTPGGSVKLGFVDDVTVLPTHRRRGIMTRMMRAQLSQMRERGEPLAALTASESLIYERFGFGIATWVNQWNIDRRHTAMRIPPRAGGALRFISPETAREEWPQLHARARKDRVGMVHYDAGYWRFALGESEILRRGATEFFHVAYLRGDHVAGTVFLSHMGERGPRHISAGRGRRGRGRTLAILFRDRPHNRNTRVRAAHRRSATVASGRPTSPPDVYARPYLAETGGRERGAGVERLR